MWNLTQPDFNAARGRNGLLLAVLCVASLARLACAAEPLIQEQDVDEQSIIQALTPEKAENRVVTRGLRYRDPGTGSDSLAPASKPSVALLITFSTNSTTLTNGARAALDKVAHALQSTQLSEYKFRIEGHADPRGSAVANMKLSADRAVAVLDYLTRGDGIAPERLSAVGKGSSEPLNTRNPAAPENRRVTIVRLPD
ncbi:OmpA family protein [Paraburkholderia oxyphila]|uniref:OmpA family protein n=1 Tax=Paraburkholderia oxyphila TaxID=614212 RepID=UPI0005BB1B58|nr:OmpA family protein [Paraburkholderia oxyphila]